MSTVKNADGWTVTFLDALDQPTEPDGPVSWWIRQGDRWYDIDGNQLTPEYLPGRRVDLASVIAFTQPVEDATSTGVYSINVTPAIPVPYKVKAAAIVDGVEQAVPFTAVEVEP